MAGISNKTIVNFFEKKTDDDLKKNFVGVFPSNYVTRFISFHEMMIEKNRYLFIIMNTDRSNKKGTHWWSFSTYTKKVLKSLLLTMTEIFLIKYYSELKNSKKKTIKLH